MSKVLFTHSFFYKLDNKQWKSKQPYPPLGTLFAAAFARENDFDVSLFDTNLRKSPNELTNSLIASNPDYLVIYDDGFNYLTKMCLTTMREAAFEMIEIAQHFDCKIIVSSSDASDHYDMYLSKGADYVITGEAEITLLELLKSIDSGKSDMSEIQGLAYQRDGAVVTSGKRSVLRVLDSLPIPAWDLVNIDEYREIWIKYHGYFSLNIATTRGCPFKCNWCAKPIYGNRYNTRSPENVIEEIELLLNQYEPDHFWMCDDIFGLKPGWIQAFRNLVNEKDLDFKYKIQSRVDLLLQEDTIDALSESGLETVWVGAESGSQKILDAMDKGTSVEQIHEATKLLQEKGIKVAFFLQFGYLGETLNDINATLNMVLKLMPDEIGISVSYPLPGTKFYEKVRIMLKDKQNWTDSDDLAMMFQNTFPPAYYRVLHRYIHNRYRIQRGIDQVKNLGQKTTTPSLRNIASMIYNTPLAWLHGYQLQKLSKYAKG